MVLLPPVLAADKELQWSLKHYNSTSFPRSRIAEVEGLVWSQIPQHYRAVDTFC